MKIRLFTVTGLGIEKSVQLFMAKQSMTTTKETAKVTRLAYTKKLLACKQGRLAMIVDLGKNFCRQWQKMWLRQLVASMGKHFGTPFVWGL